MVQNNFIVKVVVIHAFAASAKMDRVSLLCDAVKEPNSPQNGPPPHNSKGRKPDGKEGVEIRILPSIRFPQSIPETSGIGRAESLYVR